MTSTDHRPASPSTAAPETADHAFSAVVGTRRGLGRTMEPRMPAQPPRPIKSLADAKRRITGRAWIEAQLWSAEGVLIWAHCGRASPYCVPERSTWSLEYDQRTSEGHVASVMRWPRLARHCNLSGDTMTVRYRDGKAVVVRILDDNPRHETAVQRKRTEQGREFPRSLEDVRAFRY